LPEQDHNNNGDAQDWFVKDWYPMGHRMMDTGVEGNGKTTFGCQLSVCTAAGKPFLGQEVQQGRVIIIDEETPEETLINHISRFALYFGYRDWRELPIEIYSMKGFRFARKTTMDWLLHIINRLGTDEPMLLRMDSVIAMLASGRQGMCENDSNTGIALKDDMNKLLLFVRNISISAHAKKYVTDMLPKQMRATDMQAIVRGHGSIVGEAADSGIVLKRISEFPEPTRFVMVTKARRKAIPMSAQDIFVELDEEEYGRGWACLKRIEPIALPPTEIAKGLFTFFQNGDDISADHIVRKAALYSRTEIRNGLEELIERKAVVNLSEAFKYGLNPHISQQCEPEYLRKLKAKKTAKKLPKNAQNPQVQKLPKNE